jgi:hypothetical protein
MMLPRSVPRAGDAPMWDDYQYCWVVFCKNYFYHLRQNVFHRHRIPLGVTDGVTNRPAIDARFRVPCDDCGEEYLYAPSEVVRYEQGPHPLFREEGRGLMRL